MDEIKLGSLVRAHGWRLPQYEKGMVVVKIFLNYERIPSAQIVSKEGCGSYLYLDELTLVRQLTDEELLTHQDEKVRQIALERLVWMK